MATTVVKVVPPKTPPPPALTDADYGYNAAFLKAHPDVKALLRKAEKARWTDTRFAAEIKTTKWWSSRTDAQRKFDLLSNENPSEANRLVQEKNAQLTQAASNLGITLDAKTLWQLSHDAVMNGSSDGEIQSILAGKWHYSENATGAAAVDIDTLRQTAQSYGVTLDQGSLENFTRQVLGGQMTTDGFTDHIREQAKVLYPGIASALDRGLTVQQYAAPYLQMVAKETGTPLESMDLSNPKWTKMLAGSTGAPMSTDEWVKTYRNDASYGYDKSGVATADASAFATNIQTLMGARG